MKIRVALEAEVDDLAWALEYGLGPAELEADVISHLPALLTEVTQEKAAQMGTFTVTNLGTLQVLPSGALRRVG